MTIIGHLITDPRGEKFLDLNEDFEFGELCELFDINDFRSSKPFHIETAMEYLEYWCHTPGTPKSKSVEREATEVFLENFRGAISAALAQDLSPKDRQLYEACAAFLKTAVVKEVYLAIR
jgi:hypothetical protein